MNEVLDQYRNRLIQQRYSQNTIDIYCNYFKDFCNYFKDSKLGREKQYYSLPRPKKEHKLPKVLSKNEVKRIFNSCNNIKHRCILMLIYSAGLRRSELIDLEISDIDSERMVVNIKGAKGKKDRISLLSKNTLMLLRDYYQEYKPKAFLFEEQDGGKYSATSVVNILKRAVKKSGIKKRNTPYA